MSTSDLHTHAHTAHDTLHMYMYRHLYAHVYTSTLIRTFATHNTTYTHYNMHIAVKKKKQKGVKKRRKQASKQGKTARKLWQFAQYSGDHPASCPCIMVLIIHTCSHLIMLPLIYTTYLKNKLTLLFWPAFSLHIGRKKTPVKVVAGRD